MKIRLLAIVALAQASANASIHEIESTERRLIGNASRIETNLNCFQTR